MPPLGYAAGYVVATANWGLAGRAFHRRCFAALGTKFLPKFGVLVSGARGHVPIRAIRTCPAPAADVMAQAMRGDGGIEQPHPILAGLSVRKRGRISGRSARCRHRAEAIGHRAENRVWRRHSPRAAMCLCGTEAVGSTLPATLPTTSCDRVRVPAAACRNLETSQRHPACSSSRAMWSTTPRCGKCPQSATRLSS